ncbi:MAG: hypothetical protein KGI38_05975 [Thaumarchaeota archaeon]|nr:hypothetical protein [Nitrososphaerota archaeon]
MKTTYPKASVERQRGPHVDVTVILGERAYPLDNDASLTFLAQVECKGTQKDSSTALEWTDASIGQALRYLVKNVKDGPIPTYLGLPHDFYNLETLKLILAKLNLPLGLLIVSSDGTVDMCRQALTPPLRKLVRDLVEQS